MKTGSYAARLQRTGWTRPLGATAGVPEDRPGGWRTGRLLTTRLFLRAQPPPETKKRKRKKERPNINRRNPLLLLSSPSAFISRQRHGGISDVAAKCLGFVSGGLVVGTGCGLNRTRTVSHNRGLHYGFIGTRQ